MEKAILFLKPYVAWATALTDRYRFNPFARTTAHIIVLQVVLALIMVGVFTWGISYTQDSTVSSISRHITEAILSGSTSTPELVESIEDVREVTFIYLLLAVIALNTLFGYLVARFALRPTRNSLRSQKQFIGNVAHEIRTPLAIIKTNTEVALFDPSLPKGVKDTFEDTLVELDRISEIINNLLSFDTLSHPRRMEFTPVNLVDVATTVLERHQALAHERGIELTLNTPAEAVLVDGNRTALEQVVTNLTKNALNYTPAHKDGSVRIILTVDPDGRSNLTVSDTGIGIEQKDLFHIFEPFYRGDTSRARGVGTGSSGLGLAIVNEIVRFHKGTIGIRSAVGRGTAVKISFPPHHTKEIDDAVKDTTGLNEVSLDFS